MDNGLLTFKLIDHAATEALATRFAKLCEAGSVILLEGEIGAGKTTFARAFIRMLVGAEIDVPSPTFTIVQTYQSSTAEIWHCDLYRLSDPEEAIELDLESAFENSVVLVEWPDRLGKLAPVDAVKIEFNMSGEGRTVTISGPKRWLDVLSASHV